MRLSYPLLVCTISLALASCGTDRHGSGGGGGGGEGEGLGTSRLGESCAKRSDCISGLTCISLRCVEDQSTNRACSQIEASYLELVRKPESLSCSNASDCDTFDGLCHASDPETRSSMYLSSSIEPQVKSLQDEWEANGCTGGTRCIVGLGNEIEGPWCIAGSCQKSGQCDQALVELCKYSTAPSCERFGVDGYECMSELRGRLNCDKTVVSPSQLASCLESNHPDCSSDDKFLSAVFSKCGSYGLAWIAP
jgi:hypothetical protein